MSCTATVNAQMIMGGRFLFQNVEGQCDGQPVEAIGVIGYDNVTGRFQAVDFDNMGTAISQHVGARNDAGDIVLHSSYVDPGTGETIHRRTVRSLLSESEWLETAYDTRGDAERKVMEIRARRTDSRLPSRAMAEERPPIIDMHLHAYPIGSLYPPGTTHPLTGWPSPESDDAMRGENLAALERHNIVLAVTSGCPFELVRRWKEAAPERIVAAPYIGGGRACWPPVDSLREAHEAGDLGALGEFGLQYQGLTLSSPEAGPYLALAEELDIPVGIHTGRGPPGTMYRCCPDFRVALGNPLLIEEALARHPGLGVYIMHAGYPFLAETIALLHAHPQVYADLSAINWLIPRDEFHAYLRGLVRAGFSSRLMFGSDQMIWPDAIGAAIEGIESADFLTDDQKRGIFYDNAARFLRLSEEEIARHQFPDREVDSRSGSGQCLTKATMADRERDSQ